ncbi:MAG: LamG-like jellyroll fold domain-containing protein [Umezawaea sp.]
MVALVLTTVSTTPAASAAPEPACTTAEKTVAAAAVMAKRCGAKVEISTLRSETEQTFAKPLGGFTTERSMEPRWARKPDGSWTGIDTGLRVSGGVVSPVASALPVEFSAGGSGPAARVRSGDGELAITWPFGALPAPTLSGSAATYAEVLPGVDLRLTASPVGFSEVLVVKNAQAAQNPKLAKVSFGFATRNVTSGVTAAGGVEAKDGQGRVVFTSPTPLMWDSTPASAPGAAKAKAAGEPTQRRVATMPVTADNGELVVTPDAAMIADTTTRYPVFIDPSWSGRLQNNAWTLVSSNLPDSAFWQGGGFLQDAADVGAVGTGLTCDIYYNDGTCYTSTYNVRSYFQMDVSAMKGKNITGASFRIEQRWAWSCRDGGSSATVRVTNDIGGGTTWNNQPQWWGNEWASSSPANHKLGAQHNCAGPGDVEFEMTGVVRQAAAENWDHITFVIHVTDENTVKQWKRFNAATPVLAIDYNSLPNTPDQLSVDGKSCATGANRPVTPTVTPTLRARVSDPDGADTLGSRFEWARIRENGTIAAVERQDGYPWGNGTIAETTLPKPATLPTGVLDSSDKLVGTGDWDNDGHPDVLTRDGDGYLYLLPAEGQKVGNRVLLGSGWSDFTIAGVADWDGDGKRDIVARHDPSGELFLYPGDATRAVPSQPRVLIGVGFGGYGFAGLADFDRDGKQDLIAKDSSGVLWLYPGENKRSPSTQNRASLGTGWEAFTFAGVIDRTGDGKPDIIAEYADRQWLYLGSGVRGAYVGTPYRYEIGSGWAGLTARTIPDFNNDGAVDIVAQWPTSSDWYLYPGVVGTTYSGQQWAIAGRGITEGVYAYRAFAGDWQTWGPATGWCEFSVDVTAPAAPTVTASVYRTSGCAAEGCGSLGVADTFTFASTSTDVVKYRWGFTDPPSMTVPAGIPVRWTPPSDGPKTLFVEAVDRAGLSTRKTFQFTVAGAKTNDAQWFAGDDSAADTTGNGHDLTLTGLDTARAGRTVGGQGAVGFDGMAVNGATTTKVLDTSKGFSVSAWVRLTGDTASRTVVSQQGTTTAAFQLGYDAAAHKWTFSLAENDAVNATLKTAASNASAVAGVWTHLTGTYDSLDREVRLYVDGALQRTTAVVDNGFNASGQLWIGKALRSSAAAEPWKGELAEVRAWNRTLTPQETQGMADATQISGVGEWKFDEGAGSIARDTSPYGRDLMLNLAGGAKWGAGVANTSGLELNGTNSSASTSEAVLNIDQSFSVDVWAKLNDTGTPRTVVVQRGPSGVDPFALRYDGAQWSAEMPNAAANPSTWWRAKGDAVANKWTHLVVTYAAGAGKLDLTVGYQDSPDALKSTVTGVVGSNSTGVLSVGRSSAGEFFNGNVDQLTVWQGVLAPKALNPTPRTGSSISGDAHDEIISVDANGIVRGFLNVNGVYPYASQEIGSGWTPERTWFADIDGDGKSEIVGVETGGSIKAFKNVNGMNGFPYGGPTVIGSAPGEAKRIRFADIDGDGRADRVSIDADGRVRVYRNLFGLNERGQATAFATTPVIVKVTTVAPEAIRFADIDGDGKAEFITVNADQTVSAFRNLNGFGYGSYDTSQEIGSGWTSDRTWFADITGDGKAEIITVNPDGAVWSWTNLHGLTKFPYEGANQVGSGWYEPFRVFFS